MKNLTIILFVFLLVRPVFGQVDFNVPSMTDAAKHERILSQTNYIVIASVSYAKQQGLSLEDYAEGVGNLAKTTWNKEAGFDGFVKGTLYNWESFRTSNSPYKKYQYKRDDR